MSLSHFVFILCNPNHIWIAPGNRNWWIYNAILCAAIMRLTGCGCVEKKAPQPLPLQIPSWAHLSQVWAVWIRCWDGVISGGTTGGAACIIQAWIGRESHTRQDRLPLWIRSISQPLSPPAIIHKNTIWTYSNVAFTYNLVFFFPFVKLSYTMTKPLWRFQ